MMIFEPNGSIECTVIHNPIPPDTIKWKWIGGDRAELSGRVLWETKGSRTVAYVVYIGPYKVIVVDYDASRDTSMCLRMRGFHTYLYFIWYHIAQYLSTVKYRLIWTCVVWGLANKPMEASLPEWKDLKIWRKITNG